MITKSMTVNIPKGLDARPVALLVQVASQYESSIYLEIQEKKVNAKSMKVEMRRQYLRLVTQRKLRRLITRIIQK